MVVAQFFSFPRSRRKFPHFYLPVLASYTTIISAIKYMKPYHAVQLSTLVALIGRVWASQSPLYLRPQPLVEKFAQSGIPFSTFVR